MQKHKILFACAMLFLAACGDESSSASNEDTEKVFNSSSSDSDDEISSSSLKESCRNKILSSSSGAQIDPTTLFETRVPQKAVHLCTSQDGLSTEHYYDQHDWICSFRYADKSGFVYVQGSPTDCEGIWWRTPVITADTAILYVNKKYIPLTDLTYEWGGNHHSDRFRFTYDGKVYEYHHSSIGAAIRPCQEMDCMRVYKSDGETLIEDGCGTDEEEVCKIRTLPVVCRFADENGEFGDFTDTFKPCGGDNREF